HSGWIPPQDVRLIISACARNEEQKEIPVGNGKPVTSFDDVILDLILPVTRGPSLKLIFPMQIAIKSETVLGNRQNGNEEEYEQTTESNPKSLFHETCLQRTSC